MKTQIGNLPVTLEPVFGTKNLPRMMELDLKAARVMQTYHCNTGQRKPDPPQRSFDIETNLLFLVYNADGSINKPKGDALAVRFFSKTGYVGGRGLNAALQSKFGEKKGVPIPYDAMTKGYLKHSCFVLESVTVYAFLLVKYPGLAKNEEIILSVPAFAEHQLYRSGRCIGDTHKDFTMYETFAKGKAGSRQKTLNPMPREGKLARTLYYKAYIAATKKGHPSFARFLEGRLKLLND